MIYIELQHHKWQPGAWVKNPWGFRISRCRFVRMWLRIAVLEP